MSEAQNIVGRILMQKGKLNTGGIGTNNLSTGNAETLRMVKTADVLPDPDQQRLHFETE